MGRGRLAAFVLAALVAPLGLGGCTVEESNWTGGPRSGPEHSRTVVQTVPAGQFKSLTLRTGPGEVIVSGWGEQTVRVEVEKRASGADSAAVDAYLEDVRVEVKTAGDSVSLATALPPAPPAGVKLVGVRYFIRMPNSGRGALDLETDRATVRLNDLQGEAKIKVRQADVDVRGFLGALKIQMEDGQALVNRLDGQLELKSNGPVELTDSRLNTRTRVETANSRVSVDLAELGVGQYEFLTSNAPLRIAVPFGTAAHFRIATTNGRVFDELPLTWVDRNETDTDGVYRFEGWLNAGGAQVSAVTANADVTLAYR